MKKYYDDVDGIYGDNDDDEEEEMSQIENELTAKMKVKKQI